MRHLSVSLQVPFCLSMESVSVAMALPMVGMEAVVNLEPSRKGESVSQICQEGILY